MTELIIGLAGKARVGKSSVAAVLANDFGLAEIQFSGRIKRMVEAGFDWNALHTDGPEKDRQQAGLDFSPREALQDVGAVFRKHNPRVWIDLALRDFKRARERSAGSWRGAVFSGVRLDAEAAAVRSLGGIVVHVMRHDAPPVNLDETEGGVEFVSGDRVFQSRALIPDLRRDVQVLVRGLRRAA